MYFTEFLGFSNGQLTRLPKMPYAPKLKSLRFCYHPLAEIIPYSFKHLPKLESLDLSGNGATQTMTSLEPNSLAFESSNFQTLEMGSFESLHDILPDFTRNIQPHTCFNFLSSSISK